MTGPGSPLGAPSLGLSLSAVGSFQRYAESAGSNSSSPVSRFDPFAPAASPVQFARFTSNPVWSERSVVGRPSAACRLSFSSVYGSPTASDLSLDSPVKSSAAAVSEGSDTGAESPVSSCNPFAAVVGQLGFNPFAVPQPVAAPADVDPSSIVVCVSASMYRFESKFDGYATGLAAEEHLQQFFKFQRSMLPGSTDQLSRLQSQLQAFADSYANAGSRFHNWALDKVNPILTQIDNSGPLNTTAARNHAHQAADQLWQAAINDYRATFCKATQAELYTLLQTSCPDINAVRSLVIKLRALYTLTNVQAIPPEDAAVRRLLYKLQCSSLANVANGLHAALQSVPTAPWWVPLVPPSSSFPRPPFPANW